MSKHSEKLGILINNLGTPDSCEVKAVRTYLKQFLSDPRVIKIPRLIWWPILNGIILNTRPQKSAQAYERIWTDAGSPLLVISENIVNSLEQELKDHLGSFDIALGMRYGNPSIESALNGLRQAGATRYVIIPLYPQYSFTTTASVKDEVLRVFDKWNLEPEFSIACDYHDHPGYIDALTQSIQQYWKTHGRAEKLLLSFHGIPKDYVDQGDPYQSQCIKTAQLLTDALKLDQDSWVLTFQSRLGPKKWIEPYTDQTLMELAKQGVGSVQVVCPGFSVDCLETLEEIEMENRELFLKHGGKRYEYIPCLNECDQHIRFLTTLILDQLK